MMSKQIAIRRAFTLVILLSAFTALGARLVWIQNVQHPDWASLAKKYHEARRSIPARRGMILDRNGVKLAVTVIKRSVFANPRAIRDKQRVARVLANCLDLDASEVQRRLRQPRFFCWIKRHVTATEAEAVDRLGIHGVGFRHEPFRVYPCGTLSAHTLGYCGTENQGLAGIEQRFDRALSGRPGFEIVLRDGRGRTIAVGGPRYQPAVDGHSVVLSIDTVLQHVVEEELRSAVEKWEAVGGAAILLEAGTGDVLAMASFPTYDPNRFGGVGDHHRLNRAVGMVFEPGSTFKPFVAAAALDGGLVDAETRFFCHNGAHSFNGRVLHDAHGYGQLTVRDIIVKSSNIGIAKVAARLGRTGLYYTAARFGFGRPTGIELPGEEAGILHPKRTWTHYSMTSIPMGQEIAVTVAGLATGYNVFASEGRWVRPRLVLGLADNNGRSVVETFGPSPSRPVIRDDVARLICGDFLHNVVERGTARRAKLESYSIGGKTGTAQVARKDGRGYEPSAYIASFVGIGPVQSPRVVCLVMVERPRKSHYGGVVSAPAVAAIVERSLSYLGVPPKRAHVAMLEGTHRFEPAGPR